MRLFNISLVIPILFFSSLPGLADIYVTKTSIKISSGAGKSAAVYMTIKNDTVASDWLMGAKTSVAKKSMLHDTVVTSDGVVKMKHIMMGIEVNKGEKLVLKSGGKHIMLMGLTETLEAGREFKLVLSFKNSGDVETIITVGEKQ